MALPEAASPPKILPTGALVVPPAPVPELPGPANASARAARAASSGPGLVDIATSHASGTRIELSGGKLRPLLDDLARSRRLARMRKTVSRFVDVAADGLTRPGFRPALMVMVTLTYADEGAWRPRHVSEFLLRVSQWFERRGLPYAYAWTMEMQRRGVPHYHALFWVPRGVRIPMPDRLGPGQRRPFWPHGSTNIGKARSRGYIVKYATKGDLRPFPRHARIFGVGACERAWRAVARWAALPSWLREKSFEGDSVCRCGADWVSRLTGEVYGPSPWSFSIRRRDPGWCVVLECRDG